MNVSDDMDQCPAQASHKRNWEGQRERQKSRKLERQKDRQ